MNIVVVILDTLRKDYVGCYGNPKIMTPNLDALAADSLWFTRAYPESLPTIPARRAIHTGKRTFPFRDWIPQKGDTVRVYGWQRIPEDQVTLAEILKENGYTTALVADTPHLFKPSMNFHRGFDVWIWIRGQETDPFRPISLCPPDWEKRILPTARHLPRYLANVSSRCTEEDWFAPQVFRTAMQLLEALINQRPFFLVVDSFDPHEPWDPPPWYVSLYDDPDYDGPEPITPRYGKCDYLTERQLQRMRALYAGEVTMVDRWLGHFLDKMADLHLLDETFLIVLSDHGHTIGERGLTGKIPWALYPELIDIPFFLRHPEGKAAGQTSDYFASTHDIAPTALGILGIEPPRPMEGVNLSVLFEGKEPSPRPHITTGFNEFVWVRDGRYSLLCRNDGSDPHLYDLANDPNCDRDIAPDHPDIVSRLYDNILQDAGGEPLPNYDLKRPIEAWYQQAT